MYAKRIPAIEIILKELSRWMKWLITKHEQKKRPLIWIQNYKTGLFMVNISYNNVPTTWPLKHDLGERAHVTFHVLLPIDHVLFTFTNRTSTASIHKPHSLCLINRYSWDFAHHYLHSLFYHVRIVGTVKAPVFGTLNSAISNFQTWFVRTVMEVLCCWMQCNYNSFIQIINFHGHFRNASRCRKTGACRILVPLR